MRNRFFNFVFPPSPKTEPVDIGQIKSELVEFVKSPIGVGYGVGAVTTGLAGLIFMIVLDQEMRKKEDPSAGFVRGLSAVCISAGTLLLAHRIGTVGAMVGASYMAAKETISGQSNPLAAFGVFTIIAGGCYLAAKDVYKTLTGGNVGPRM